MTRSFRWYNKGKLKRWSNRGSVTSKPRSFKFRKSDDAKVSST